MDRLQPTASSEEQAACEEDKGTELARREAQRDEWARRAEQLNREAEERERQKRCQERLQALADDLGPRLVAVATSFDTYRVRCEGQQQILARVRALANRLPDMINRGESMVLYGTVGTGKDHLMATMLYTAARVHEVSARFARSSVILDGVRWGMLKKATLVALSDPVPPAGLRDRELNELFKYVDDRYAAGLPVWLSVNATGDEDLEAKLGSQVLDRLRDGGHLLPCFWPSWREGRQAS